MKAMLAGIPALLFLTCYGPVFVRPDGGDDSTPDSDAGSGDGGDVHVDPKPADQCGDDTHVLVLEPGPFATISTDMLTNQVPMCGASAADGTEAFVALDVEAGERWHVHVIADDPDADPVLYWLDSACDTRDCTVASDYCTGVGDEHFTVEANATERLYVGIDDRNPGAHSYRVLAIRPTCGDNVQEHGEACDSSDPSCLDCRRVLSGSAVFEVEPNDNGFDANVLDDTPTMTIQGATGDICVFPDSFRLRVDAGGLAVDLLTPAGDVCTDPALTPFDLVLHDAAGALISQELDPVTGCPRIAETTLPSGTYTITIVPRADLDRPTAYTMRVTR